MHRRSSTSSPLRRLLLSGTVLGALILAACTPQAPDASETAASSSPSTSPSVTESAAPEPTGPALMPDGSAEDNLPYFTGIVEAVWATPENAQGRAYIDALTAAGFDKAAMQVTLDQSTVGNQAESMQFSVLWGESCLIGQVGPATGAPFTAVADALDGGMCLIGTTRPIDW